MEKQMSDESQARKEPLDPNSLSEEQLKALLEEVGADGGDDPAGQKGSESGEDQGNFDAAAAQEEINTLKSRLQDRESTIGRQGRELGDLRQRLEAIENQSHARQQSSQQEGDDDFSSDDASGLDPKRVARLIDAAVARKTSQIEQSSAQMSGLVNYIMKHPKDWSERLNAMDKLVKERPSVSKLVQSDPSAAMDLLDEVIDAGRKKEASAPSGKRPVISGSGAPGTPAPRPNVTFDSLTLEQQEKFLRRLGAVKDM